MAATGNARAHRTQPRITPPKLKFVGKPDDTDDGGLR
jgi:hypothetical protein